MAQKNFYKKLLGRAGEVRAANFLKKKGLEIIETNYKTRVGEIDIIAKDKNAIVFIEVKTRSDDGYGAPAEAVDRKKREKYFKTATEYLVKNEQTESECRFDVVEINNGEINHIIDAFCIE
ncbi:MAG: YraN family protein [Clostridia bacterium]|nr:YraN family protein [Clostridia bacterium]